MYNSVPRLQTTHFYKNEYAGKSALRLTWFIEPLLSYKEVIQHCPNFLM